jgi:hypothetical protein
MSKKSGASGGIGGGGDRRFPQTKCDQCRRPVNCWACFGLHFLPEWLDGSFRLEEAGMSEKEKVAASVTIHEIPNMTLRGRKNICNWLRQIARDIAKEPQVFSKTFRARYLYEERDKDV